MIREFFRPLRLPDYVTIVFLTFLCLLVAFFAQRLSSFLYYIPVNIACIMLILWMGRYTERHPRKRFSLIHITYDWYLVPAILFIYTQSSSIAFPLHGRDYDNYLIQIDQILFGGDPSQWMSRIHHPVVTEILQASYFCYYIFFILLFAELYKKNMMKEFIEGAFIIVYGFYLSYIGYLLLPAVGPRFTLYDFSAYDNDLPGLFLTPLFRAIINSGGGIVSMADPLATVHRDAFPSGHTQLTLVAMYLSVSARLNVRWFICTIGALLIVSTLYLRYHYGIDLIAGFFFFLFTVWSGKVILGWWEAESKNLR